MLREEDLPMAYLAYTKEGHPGYAINEQYKYIITMEQLVEEIKQFRFLIDWDEKIQPDSSIGGAETPQEEPEEATQEEEPEPEETPQGEMEAPKTKTVKTRRSKEEVEQLILKAWNGGERSISEIMNITGCTHATVRRYIPISPNG